MLAALVGALAGLVVTAMGFGVDTLHRVLFHLGPGVRLSGLLHLDPVIAISVPLVGGIVFGIARELIAHWRPEREIDPIEANALHGGRMSLLGSIIVAAETVWSSGVGASVGMEAGYTQFASGIASRIGMAFRLRRADLRILVGCGAAGGIAGAFGAPLAGAFYGFELIIGGYTPQQLGAGRGLGADRLSGRADARSCGPRRRCARPHGRHRAGSRHRRPHRAALRRGGHRDHARRRVLRGSICSAEAAIHAPHRDRRTPGRAAGDAGAAGDVLRPRRTALCRNAAIVAGDGGAAVRAQDRSLGHLARLRLPRRLVLFLAADRRARAVTCSPSR